MHSPLLLLAATLSSTSLTQKALISPQRSRKRSRSPTIVLAVERSSRKRRQQRQRPVSSLSVTIKISQSDTTEQENDDEDETIGMSYGPPKQRQPSSGSVEYVHVVSHDSQTAVAASLNNIENLQSKSNPDDLDIIVCHSPTKAKKLTSPKKTHPHSIKAHSPQVLS